MIFGENRLRDLIIDLDDEENSYFSIPAAVFGKTIRVDTHADKIVWSIAERIYYVRNAMVHNKEGEREKFIPFF